MSPSNSSRRLLVLSLASAVTLGGAGFSYAEAPTTKPTTKPAVSAADFPSPADLIKKMKDKKDAVEKKLQVAYLDLSSMPISEKPSGGFSLFGGTQTVSLRELVERLDRAREDKDIKAVLLTMGTGVGIGMAQAQELRAELEQLRRDGKRVFVHADSMSTVDYFLASAATDVCLMPSGELFMPGIGLETMHYKGIMDKLGVKADYIQIGEYKGAEEPYTRSEPSEELKGEMNKLAKAISDEIVSGISLSRSKSADDVRRMIDDAIMDAKQLKKQGFVDHLVDLDGVRDMLKEELGDDVNLVRDYGAAAKPEVDFENIFSILAAMNKKEPETTKPKIAIVYAQGVISDGEGGGGGLLGGEAGIGSEPIRRAMRLAARDENVKAIVLRIDSPGGSALASEVMWQSIRRVAKDKPVVVSIGGMAASGGYYMSVAGDHIVADPAAIIGSIGVVGGKFVLGGLYDKVGLTTFSFTEGRNAALFSSSTEWSDAQRRMVRNWMKDTYDQFTDRVMQTREGKIKDIDQVARGRIFTARQAKELGMVDQLGGLEVALDEAAKRAKLDAGAWDTKVLPPAPTIADMFGGGGGPSMVSPLAAGRGVSADAAVFLSLLPDSTRKGLIHFVQMGEQMNKSRKPVVLMMPYTIELK
jgi:protease IV